MINQGCGKFHSYSLIAYNILCLGKPVHKNSAKQVKEKNKEGSCVYVFKENKEKIFKVKYFLAGISFLNKEK